MSEECQHEWIPKMVLSCQEIPHYRLFCTKCGKVGTYIKKIFKGDETFEEICRRVNHE